MVEHDEFGPEKVIEVYDPATGMHGFVVIDNSALGPGKGGIRMTPTLTKAEVARLARAMTWKNALAEIPFGGAKSGIIASPKQISAKKKEEIVKAFSKAISIVSPGCYIAAPDMNMSEQDMRWFVQANGDDKSATGKPKDMGGLPHELGSTGFGVYHATKVAAEYAGLKLSKARIAVEGFGNVGRAVAGFISKEGCRLVAVSDSKGVVSNYDGIDFGALAKIKDEKGSVTEYRPGVCTSCESILDVDADILITAAIPDLIKAGDVKRLRCRLIVEGSNIPMTHEVEELCQKKGILVVPDFVANAGGVISSYVEYKGGDEKKMFMTIKKKIVNNVQTVLQKAKDKKANPRDTALDIAKERIRSKMVSKQQGKKRKKVC